MCYAPTEAPVSWTIDVGLPDQIRITSGPPSDATASFVLDAVAGTGWRDIPTAVGSVRTFVAGGDDVDRPPGTSRQAFAHEPVRRLRRRSGRFARVYLAIQEAF